MLLNRGVYRRIVLENEIYAFAVVNRAYTILYAGLQKRIIMLCC